MEMESVHQLRNTSFWNRSNLFQKREVPAIGIDLGTTRSCVGIYQNGSVHIIANDHGDTINPSCVAFTDTEILFGDDAENQITTNPSNTVFDVKRLIGLEWDDFNLQTDMKRWPFEVIAEEGNPKIRVEYRKKSVSFHPKEISSMLLGRMKKIAERHLRKVVSNAVITVPAYFNNLQRKQTKNAAISAGLNVLRIINEPTAAAIAYCSKTQVIREKTILVYHLGAGTFDVSIITINSGQIRVLATAGNTHLGGEDFDYRMVKKLIQKFHYLHPKKDLKSDKTALQKLKVFCEKAKRTLSSYKLAYNKIDCLFEDIDFDFTFTRVQFEELNDDLFLDTLDLVKKVLRDARLDKGNIDDVVLVGGSTRIPKVQQLLHDFFKREKLNEDMIRDDVVVSGAAIQAAILNPGRSEHICHLEVQDVIPRCVGVEAGGLMKVVISRNTNIPTTKTHDKLNDKPGILLHVYEGDGIIATDNNLLVELQGASTPAAPCGSVLIIATFNIDNDGIIDASGCYEERYIKNKIFKGSKNQLSRNACGDSDDYWKGDKKNTNRTSAKASLEEYICSLKQSIGHKGMKDKISEEDKQKMLIKIEHTIQWISRNQSAAERTFELKKKELQNIWYPIITNVYQSDSPKQVVPSRLPTAREESNTDGFAGIDNGSEIV